MKVFYSLLFCLLQLYATGFAQSGDGHTPTLVLSYVPAGYSTAPTMRQNVASTSASSIITDGSAADIFVNFTYDTGNKNVFLVYTTNGSNPSKSNGTAVNGTFSKYTEPNRTWVTRVPAGANTASTTVKYVLYISDSNLASAFGRVSAAGQAGYQTTWNEGDQALSYNVDSALPVNLVSFNAKANGRMASLDWATTGETNNAYFDVERSPDAVSFAKMGRVAGQGVTTTRRQYGFTDEAPAPGVNYYRLKQVDISGAFSYSPIRAVAIRTNGEVTVLGNPATTDLQVAGLLPGSTAQLLDLSGQLRQQQAAGQDRLQFDVRDLPAGMYLLRVVEATGTLTKRVLVAH